MGQIKQTLHDRDMAMARRLQFRIYMRRMHDE